MFDLKFSWQWRFRSRSSGSRCCIVMW